MATVGGMIYAFGGYGMGYGIIGCNSWERYDPNKDEWFEMPKMAHSAAVGPGVLAGRLFYVGQFNRFTISTVRYLFLLKILQINTTSRWWRKPVGAK